MSLDNVLGVAAASHGDVPLLIFGAAVVSMAILMVGGGLFANLLDRLWWLAYVGAAIIAWTGADRCSEDAALPCSGRRCRTSALDRSTGWPRSR